MANPFTPLLQAIWQTKIARYLMVACVGATVDVLLFALLIYGFDVHYLWAGVGAFLVSTLTNYLLSVRFVFSAGARFGRAAELGVIYAVSTTGLVWHQLILYVCVEWFHVHVMLSKLVALGLVFFWNYLIRRYYVFAHVRHLR